VSNKYGKYPTFLRTIPSTYKVSKSLIALMQKFNWNRFQAVVGNTSNWREAASTLRQRSVVASLHMNPDVFFEEPYYGVEEMPSLVEKTYKLTRSMSPI